MIYKVTFNDGTTEIIEAPDREIARAWAWEDANDKDKRVKSMRRATEWECMLHKAETKLDFTDEACARLFGVSRPTVKRWRNGTTAPHRAMRRLLSDVLKKGAD